MTTKATQQMSTANQLRRLSIGALFAIAALGNIGTVEARGNQPDLRIAYHAHELDSSASASVMYRRLQAKVERFCSDSGIRTLHRKRQEQACLNSTLDDVIVKIDNDRLTEIHSGHTADTRF